MATFSKLHLSSSSAGQPIKVAATGTPGTTIHTTSTSSTAIDEVWIYANNTSASAVVLTIEFGGVTNPDNTVILSIPAQAGLSLVLPGLTLSGTGSAGRIVSAFAATTNVINISGYINRVS
jgi:hypothetical protein